MEDLTQLIADLCSLLIKLGITRLVSYERRSEDVLVAESKSCTSVVGASDGLGRVTLEHKDGSVEGGLRTSLFCKEIPGVLHGRDIIFLKIKRETGVHKTALLTRRGINIDLGPPGKIAVVSRLGGNGNRLEVVEGLRDLRIDSLDTFLDEPEKNNRL
jgi:hypothetical protein